MGAGVAFAEKYNETNNVAFVSMGDGAVRQGALHETFNMAMMWKLPVVFDWCVTGGVGADVFVMSNGRDTITDFRIEDGDKIFVDDISQLIILEIGSDVFLSTANVMDIMVTALRLTCIWSLL